MSMPLSHVTDALGEAQLRKVFASAGWAVNKIERDYGIDFDVQLFENSLPTGEWFKVQLKSSESTQYSARGDFISETLSREHASHYSLQIADPVFVIHVDVSTTRLFWLAPQLETPVALDDPRESVTVRIETANELPSTLPQLVAALRRILLKLGARQVARYPVSDFANALESEDQSRLIKSFQDKTDSLRINQVHILTDQHKFDAARSEIKKILSGDHSSVESKFSALIAKERTEYLFSRTLNAPQSFAPTMRLSVAKELQELTGPT